MAELRYNCVITDEAIEHIRTVQGTPGWYYYPDSFAISEVAGDLDKTRTSGSENPIWMEQLYSGISKREQGQLGHITVIAPDQDTVERKIGEIYFYYKDSQDQKFLFGVAQPVHETFWTPGAMLKEEFIFTLTNAELSTNFIIKYTFPQDIDSHNRDENAHVDAMKRILAKAQGDPTLTFEVAAPEKLTDAVNLEILDKKINTKFTNGILRTLNTKFTTRSFAANNLGFLNCGATWINNNFQNFNTNKFVLLGRPAKAINMSYTISTTYRINSLIPAQTLMSFNSFENSIGVDNLRRPYLNINGEIIPGTTQLINNQKVTFKLFTLSNRTILQVLDSSNQIIDTINAYQPWIEIEGANIYLGWGGNLFTENFWFGTIHNTPKIQINSNVTSTSTAGSTYIQVNSSIHPAYTCIVPSGTIDLIIPNGRNGDKTLHNLFPSITLQAPSIVNLLEDTTIVMDKNGILTIAPYTISENPPEDIEIGDLWLNTDENILNKSEIDYPNFSNTGCTISNGVISKVNNSAGVILPTALDVSEDFKIVLSTTLTSPLTNGLILYHPFLQVSVDSSKIKYNFYRNPVQKVTKRTITGNYYEIYTSTNELAYIPEPPTEVTGSETTLTIEYSIGFLLESNVMKAENINPYIIYRLLDSTISSEELTRRWMDLGCKLIPFGESDPATAITDYTVSYLPDLDSLKFTLMSASTDDISVVFPALEEISVGTEYYSDTDLHNYKGITTKDITTEAEEFIPGTHGYYTGNTGYTYDYEYFYTNVAGEALELLPAGIPLYEEANLITQRGTSDGATSFYEEGTYTSLIRSIKINAVVGLNTITIQKDGSDIIIKNNNDSSTINTTEMGDTPNLLSLGYSYDSKQNPLVGTIDLNTSTFSFWEWNGLSSNILTWTELQAARVGRVLEDLVFKIDNSVELVKRTDLESYVSAASSLPVGTFLFNMRKDTNNMENLKRANHTALTENNYKRFDKLLEYILFMPNEAAASPTGGSATNITNVYWTSQTASATGTWAVTWAKLPWVTPAVDTSIRSRLGSNPYFTYDHSTGTIYTPSIANNHAIYAITGSIYTYIWDQMLTITGRTAASNDLCSYPRAFGGAFYLQGAQSGRCANDQDGGSVANIQFNSSRVVRSGGQVFTRGVGYPLYVVVP